MMVSDSSGSTLAAQAKGDPKLPNLEEIMMSDRERKIRDEFIRAGIGSPMTSGESIGYNSARALLMKKGSNAASILGKSAPRNWGEAAELLADLDARLGK